MTLHSSTKSIKPIQVQLHSASYSILIDGVQTDLFISNYDCTIEVYYNGELIYQRTFTPHSSTFNYTTAIDLAINIVSNYKRTSLKRKNSTAGSVLDKSS